MGTPHQQRSSASASAADAQEEVDFLDESLPVLDDEEMEDLYRHFLLDDMPEVFVITTVQQCRRRVF